MDMHSIMRKTIDLKDLVYLEDQGVHLRKSDN